MKKTWFHHYECTHEEANDIIERYKSRNIKTEKKLSCDYKSWNVSALLPEYECEPVPSRVWQQKIWDGGM